MKGERTEVNREDSLADRGGKTGQPQLKKELNLSHMVGMVVGGIIGSGIFISPREVVVDVQSYGMALLVWFFAGVLAMGGGLCYSELGTMIKKSGGEFAFLKTAYSFTNETSRHHVVGELISFLFAWTNSLFGKPAASAIVLLTLGEYTMKAFQWYGEISTTSIRLLAIFTLGKKARSIGVIPLWHSHNSYYTKYCACCTMRRTRHVFKTYKTCTLLLHQNVVV